MREGIINGWSATKHRMPMRCDNTYKKVKSEYIIISNHPK